jgi:glycosyltransferase involved in cell wall biosynthesis
MLKTVRTSFVKPKVSVVIPTYNRAEKVLKTIESVLSQTFRDFEVVVVDDGSTDDTTRVLGELFGDRIRYFPQVNQGASMARNKGIAEARGEWIAFLDSDDLWEKDKLEWQMKAIEQFGGECGGCYTDTRLFNHVETRTLLQMAEKNYRHQGTVGVSNEVLQALVKPGGAGMVVCLSSFLGRAEDVRKTKFDPKLPYSQDSEFLFRLAMRTKFCYVNRPLVWFDRGPVESRHVGVSSEWNKMDFFLRDGQARLEGLLHLSQGLSKQIQKLIRSELRSIHSGWANWYLETGQYGKARESVRRAAQIDPTFNMAVKWLLVSMNPQFALRTVRQNQERTKDSASIV